MLEIFRILMHITKLLSKKCWYQFLVLARCEGALHLCLPLSPSDGIIICHISVSLAQSLALIFTHKYLDRRVPPHCGLIITVPGAQYPSGAQHLLEVL